MKMLYIWDADYPWDIRVEKLCKAMINNGHEVHVAARNLKKRVEYENIDGLHIHRTKIWPNDKINYFLSFPLFFSPIWKRFLDGIINKHSIDVVMVRDLPLALAGLWAARRANIPAVLDMAEDYVSMVKDIWRLRKFQGFNLVVRNPYLAKLVERQAFMGFDHIIVVVDEAQGVVINGGGDREKITIVSNTPELAVFEDSAASTSEFLETIGSHYSVIYTGGIQMGRGLQTVIEAMPTIVQKIPDFRFVIVGDGYAADTIKALIADSGIEEHVIWVGWVDHSEIYHYIRACKAGVIPHFVTEHVQTTIPNKIFDYMGCGIPVIASDAPPMKKIIESEACGASFKGGDANDLARALIDVFESSTDFGANGKQAVTSRYNWEQDQSRLLNVLNHVT